MTSTFPGMVVPTTGLFLVLASRLTYDGSLLLVDHPRHIRSASFKTSVVTQLGLPPFRQLSCNLRVSGLLEHLYIEL